MKYKHFDELVNLNRIDGVNVEEVQYHIHGLVQKIVLEPSSPSIKLFVHIVGKIKSKQKVSVFSNDSFKWLESEYRKDPSNFMLVFIYAMSLKEQGDGIRSQHLLKKLNYSGWKDKELINDCLESIDKAG
ncbi:hypothetical protein P7F88_22350 [Vibrio hannami]|uniref:hypothetical protein n=1 Tax=Vibrio hannami TaxID=2717094 RepID=UPI00240FD7A1|nr:hypothetical protein [Vibrio hannami]MDG3088653.1 hypothetical protein [Vibrio hannami]